MAIPNVIALEDCLPKLIGWKDDPSDMMIASCAKPICFITGAQVLEAGIILRGKWW